MPGSRKNELARLVANRISGTFFQFPCVTLGSNTGATIVNITLTNASRFEANPYWWCHLYLSNLLENVDTIKEMLKTGPVVTTNYTGAFRNWMKAAGIDLPLALVPDILVQPSAMYRLRGEPLYKITDPNNTFSLSFLNKLHRSINGSKDRRLVDIRVEELRSLHNFKTVNKVAVAITDDLSVRYPQLLIRPDILYTTTDIPTKSAV